MNEFSMIERIVEALGDRAADRWIKVGPGDDGAVVAMSPDMDAVASIDALLPDVHFPANAPPRLVGRRALAVSLSDLAAMGADPKYCIVALTVPALATDWVVELALGMADVARQVGCYICGGNVARGPLNIAVSVHGEVPKGLAVQRAGARLGDVLQLSGPVGLAAACVRTQKFGVEGELTNVQRAYYQPQPRFDLTSSIREKAHACIDVSDGLVQDLGHILALTDNLGAELRAGSIPHPDPATIDDALWGGDDYQLLVAAPMLLAGFEAIGEVSATPGVRLDDVLVSDRGYDHFA